MAKSTEVKPLPHNAIIHQPRRKQHDVVFILVHQYGGSHKSLARHIRMLNDLGYTAVSFELEGAHNQKMFIPPIGRNYKWGLRFVWADRIEDILKNFPGEEKIIFSLSNPSNSVFEALQRTQCHKVKALICDGGPFFDVHKCYYNLFTYAFKYILPLRLLQMIFGAIYWNTISYKKQMRSSIKSFGHLLPLLSIRCDEDLLVPVSAIDKALASYPKQNLNTHLIKKTGHLMGIKLHSKEYRAAVVAFLSKI